jgi:hypothetical protein
MSRQTQLIVLGVLLVGLIPSAFFFYRSYFPSADISKPVAVDERFTPLSVDNPALRLDILKRFLALEYKGVHRNIFSASLPPPPAPPPSKQPPVNAGPVVPPPPPPLTVDAKYFGFVSDFGGSHRRAFFATNNNEDVIIAGEGDTLMGRFRVIRLTNTVADVEEVASGRRATLTLEEGGPNG